MQLIHILTVVVLLGTWNLASSTNNYAWSEWGAWSLCSNTCGNGTMTRSRTCDPYYGPEKTCCEGDYDQIINCSLQPCVNCSYVNFTEWSACGICGGFQYRVGICSCPLPNVTHTSYLPLPFGSHQIPILPKPFCLGPQPYQFRVCNISAFCLPPPLAPTTPTTKRSLSQTPTSPLVCSFGNFSDFTQCNATCNGTRYRRQLCQCIGEEICSASYNDSLCAGVPNFEYESCGTGPCNCHYEYNSYSQCTECCGGGSQYLIPTCVCNGNTTFPNSYCYEAPPVIQNRSCNTQPCCFYGTTLGEYVCPTPSNTSVCAHPYAKFPCLCPTGPNGTLVSSNDSFCKLPVGLFDISTFPYVYNESAYCIVYNQVASDPSQYYFNTTQCYEFENGVCTSFQIRYSPFVGQEGTEIIFDVKPSNSCVQCNVIPTDYTSCCGNCTAGGTRFRFLTAIDQATCHYAPILQAEACIVPGCCGICANCLPFNCSATCGVGTQYVYPVCDCADLSLCPAPKIEILNCPGLPACCSFVGTSNSSCGVNSVLFSTEKCVCPEGNTAGACDIASCYGAPNNTIVSCVPPTPPPVPVPATIPGPVPIPTPVPVPIAPPVPVPIAPPVPVPIAPPVPIPAPIPVPAPSPVPVPIAPPAPIPPIQNGTSSYCVLVITSVSPCNGTCPPSTSCTGVAIGHQTINRTCICNGVPSNSSLCPPVYPLVQTIPCTLYCPTCQWSPYTPWTNCSVPCGCGTRARSRTCSCPSSIVIVHNHYGDIVETSSPCPGTGLDQSPCNLQDCVIPQNVQFWAHHLHSWPSNTLHNTFPACTSLTWNEIIKKEHLSTWEKLAVEYIAAQLNVLNGVLGTPVTLASIKEAETLLSGCVPYSAFDQIVDILCSFNNGGDEYVYSSVSSGIVGGEDSELDETSVIPGEGVSDNNFKVLVYGLPAIAVGMILVVVIIVVVRHKCKKIVSPVVEQQIV